MLRSLFVMDITTKRTCQLLKQMKGCKVLGRNDHGPHLASGIKVMAEEVSMIWSFGKLDWPNGAVLPCEDFMLFWKD